jgi:thiaminase/transcriptional activator TenA
MSDAAGRFAESDHDRFTDWLRARSEPVWTAASDHRFTRELAAGTVDDAAFAEYLVQDIQFVDALVSVVGHAAGQAPTTDAAVGFAEFLTVIGTDETDYFERSFDALDVADAERTDPELWPVTAKFDDLLHRAAREGGYAETLSVLVPVEWVYLTWGERAAAGERTGAFYLDEWIDLHAGPEFRDTVEFLRAELDAVGPDLSPRRERRVARHFERAVELEVAFFDAALG